MNYEASLSRTMDILSSYRSAGAAERHLTP